MKLLDRWSVNTCFQGFPLCGCRRSYASVSTHLESVKRHSARMFLLCCLPPSLLSSPSVFPSFPLSFVLLFCLTFVFSPFPLFWFVWCHSMTGSHWRELALQWELCCVGVCCSLATAFGYLFTLKYKEIMYLAWVSHLTIENIVFLTLKFQNRTSSWPNFTNNFLK